MTRSATSAASSRTAARPSEWWPWLGLALVLLVPIWWGLDSRFPWDVDHIAPGPVLKAMAARFGGQWNSSYGPIPYIVTGIGMVPPLLALRVAGELGVPSSTYPWGFRHPTASIGLLVLVARLVTLALALAAAWLSARAARRFAPATPGWFVPIALAGSATFAYYSRTSNVDMHALFWLFLAFDRLEQSPRRLRWLCLAGAAAAWAVCCKEQVTPIAIVILGTAMLRSVRGASRSALRRAGAALAVSAASALAYAAAWRLPWGFPGWLTHHHFLFEKAVYPRAYALDVEGLAGLALKNVEYLPLVLGPVLLIACALALFARVSWRGLAPRAIACALYLVWFIGTIGYVYPRFLLPLLLLAIPLGARAAQGVSEALRERPEKARLVAAVAILLALAGGPVLSWTMLRDPRISVERWLEARVPPGAEVEIAGNPHFQPRLPPRLNPLFTRPADLTATPRPPLGDVVLVSSLDEYRFQRDPLLRARWWEPLHAIPPLGEYAPPIEFRPDPVSWLIHGLPVAPKISLFIRSGGGAAGLRAANPPAESPDREQDPEGEP
jgi:hypothetical protein